MAGGSVVFDSTLEAVDAAEEVIRGFAEDAGFKEDDLYFIGLAAREIVTNAVKHGNRFDPAKKVRVALTLDGARIVVEVIDQGAGFRLDDVPDPRRPENLEKRSGRGIMMTLAVMDEFFAEHAAGGGTHIRMAKRLPRTSEADAASS